MNLNVKLSKKLGGGKLGARQKSGRAIPTQAPLRIATVALSLLCDVRYSTITIKKLSWEFSHLLLR